MRQSSARPALAAHTFRSSQRNVVLVVFISFLLPLSLPLPISIQLWLTRWILLWVGLALQLQLALEIALGITSAPWIDLPPWVDLPVQIQVSSCSLTNHVVTNIKCRQTTQTAWTTQATPGVRQHICQRNSAYFSRGRCSTTNNERAASVGA